MKCERCNNEIKDGELFCSNCGAKKEVETTTKIDIRALKDENNSKEEDKDVFYQKDLEKKSYAVNGFFIFIILLLIAGIVYLICFDNTIIKRDMKEESKEDVTKKINYEDVSLTLDNKIDTSYENNRLFLRKEGITASFYRIEENYQDIIKDAREILLKWEEQGLRIDSRKEDGTIYEFLGTYQYNNFAIFITSFQDSTFVLEASFSTIESYNQEKDSIKEILKTIQPIQQDSFEHSTYPDLELEFNSDPLGSQ